MRRMNMVANAAVVATRSNPTPQETPTAAESLLLFENKNDHVVVWLDFILSCFSKVNFIFHYCQQ